MGGTGIGGNDVIKGGGIGMLLGGCVITLVGGGSGIPTGGNGIVLVGGGGTVLLLTN